MVFYKKIRLIVLTALIGMSSLNGASVALKMLRNPYTFIAASTALTSGALIATSDTSTPRDQFPPKKEGQSVREWYRESMHTLRKEKDQELMKEVNINGFTNKKYEKWWWPFEYYPFKKNNIIIEKRGISYISDEEKAFIEQQVQQIARDNNVNIPIEFVAYPCTTNNVIKIIRILSNAHYYCMNWSSIKSNKDTTHITSKHCDHYIHLSIIPELLCYSWYQKMVRGCLAHEAGHAYNDHHYLIFENDWELINRAENKEKVKQLLKEKRNLEEFDADSISTDFDREISVCDVRKDFLGAIAMTLVDETTTKNNQFVGGVVFGALMIGSGRAKILSSLAGLVASFGTFVYYHLSGSHDAHPNCAARVRFFKQKEADLKNEEKEKSEEKEKRENHFSPMTFSLL